MWRLRIIFALSGLCACSLQAQIPGTVQGVVDFTDKIRGWDGFGVNYVETAQTYYYNRYSQDYGGFSRLKDADKNEIISLIFGNDGLRPSIVKMFLDPLHQKVENGAYDHATTTRNMRFFVKEGLNLTEKRNDQLQVITTLYGPPAYITVQNRLRGRDINPEKVNFLTDYVADWADYLIKEEKIPLKYVSLNNEGEDWRRWPEDGGADELVDKDGHDYNVYMDPDMLVKCINSMRTSLDTYKLKNVGVTNGEPTNWYRFWAWNYAKTIANDKSALKNLALITSHGFYVGGMESPRWFGPHSNIGTQLLQSKKKNLKAWVTSTAWNIVENGQLQDKSKRTYISNAAFLKQIHGNIYEAQCNALIPWAIIQNASHWNKPDPNPGCAFRVYDDGTWEIRKGYYYYKQVTVAGRPGMAVTHTATNESSIALIAFASNKTSNPNSFVLVNWSNESFKIQLKIEGNNSNRYQAYRTSGEEVYRQYDSAQKKVPDGENFEKIADVVLTDGYLIYEVPAMSATTFIEQK